jgi:hypothetical protein
VVIAQTMLLNNQQALINSQVAQMTACIQPRSNIRGSRVLQVVMRHLCPHAARACPSEAVPVSQDELRRVYISNVIPLKAN